MTTDPLSEIELAEIERGSLDGAVEMLAGEMMGVRDPEGDGDGWPEYLEVARPIVERERRLVAEVRAARDELARLNYVTRALTKERDDAEHQTAGLLDDLGEAHALLNEAKIEEGGIAERVSFLLSSRENARADADRARRRHDVWREIFAGHIKINSTVETGIKLADEAVRTLDARGDADVRLAPGQTTSLERFLVARVEELRDGR